MSEVETTTLDYIENIVVPGDVFHEPANEYWALACLWDGMRYLYTQAFNTEEIVRERIKSDQVKLFSFDDGKLDPDGLFIGGRLPEGLKDISTALLTSSVQWYAVSACQFVRLVGAIAKKLDDSRPLPDDYAKPILPEVLPYRNKVAAHFVWSSENRRDNNAERLASILPQITYARGRFRTGSMTVSLRQGEKSSNSGAIKEWSLTEVHEQLIKRYATPVTLPASGSDTPASEPPADPGQRP